MYYASITSCRYLEPGEPAERALIFTERCGLEHFRPEFNDDQNREFYEGVFGHPSTWRRLDKRTFDGRAAVAASGALHKLGEQLARCNQKVYQAAMTAGCTEDEIPDEDLQAERTQLRDAYHAGGLHYVDMVRRLPITPHPGVPASYRPQKWWLRENPEHPFTLNICSVAAGPVDRVQDLGQPDSDGRAVTT